MIKSNRIDDYLKEKEEVARIWTEIKQISRNLHFSSEELAHFIRISCTYGRIKYELFTVSWQIMLFGYKVEKTGQPFDREIMDEYIRSFDQLSK